MKQQVLHYVSEEYGVIAEIRRHLHSHPELSCMEFKTESYICSQLERMGIPFRRGVAGTGVVAVIEGCDPGSRSLVLRADMDALPITEENDVPYMSKNPGVMHACGHDVHMACLLGAASVISRMKDKFSGTVKLIFQPSEETYPGGAVRMIGEGVLENPAPFAAIALHVINNLEAGMIGLRGGPYMASTDEFFLTVKGRGGHAATPSQVTDPVVIASHIVIALQQIVSRRADPVTPTVVSIGKITGEGRTNVIPSEVKMEGTVRTYDEAWRKEVHRLIHQVSQGIAEAMNATCEVKIAHGYPYLNNDPALTEKLRVLAAEYLGESNVHILPQRMTAEDFAYFAQQIPSCLFRLGISNLEKGLNANLHTSAFDVDESSLGTGAGTLAWMALRLLQPEGTYNNGTKD